MNWKHLIYAIPLCLVIGFIFGVYINLPKHITIDTGDNLKNLSILALNISQNYNAACHNLTFECNCDNYDMTELNKQLNFLRSYTLQDVRNRCDETQAITYMCMYRHWCSWITDDFCNDTYNIWGKNIT